MWLLVIRIQLLVGKMIKLLLLSVVEVIQPLATAQLSLVVMVMKRQGRILQ